MTARHDSPAEGFAEITEVKAAVKATKKDKRMVFLNVFLRWRSVFLVYGREFRPLGENLMLAGISVS